MAIDRLKSDLEAILNSGNAYITVQKELRKVLSGWNGRYFTITVEKGKLARKFQVAWVKAVKKLPPNDQQYVRRIMRANKNSYKKRAFEDAINHVVKKFNKSDNTYGRKMFRSSYTWASNDILKIGGTNNIKFWIKGPTATGDKRSIFNAGKRLRNEFWETWKKETIKNTVGSVRQQQIENVADTAEPATEARVVHDEDTTVYVDWLDQRATEIQIQMGLHHEEFDLAAEILAALDVDFEEDTYLAEQAEIGEMQQTRVVRARLGPRNLRTRFDASNSEEILSRLWLLQRGLELGDKFPYLSKKQAAQFIASTPFKKQVQQAAVHKATKTIVKQAKKKRLKVQSKVKTKKPKSKKRKGTLRKGKKKKTTTGKVTLQEKLAVAKMVQRKEKGTKEKGNETSLVKLKKYINSRLGAEVRRNMGRPALMNRTGRFSNSVELLSLTEGQNTIVAKYTYLLNPYATFENTGKRRWPLAYNPKPLIAKSIRNLAQGRIEQKLTVRRV